MYIQTHFQENTLKNNADDDSDGQKWGIYSFAIGDRAPISELDKLSHQNMGSSTQVKDNEGQFFTLPVNYDHFRSVLITSGQLLAKMWHSEKP